MVPITAVVITLNEERNIGRCLDSLGGVADEVIVVDSGSSDRTCQIARDKGARVIVHAWEGYGAQKNFANACASHSYILSLDADEALSEVLRESILAGKRQGLAGVYGFARLTNYCGQWIRYGGWYPNRRVRLFPKATSRWSGDPVHEGLRYEDQSMVTWLDGDLLHYSYYTPEEHRDRTRAYARLSAPNIQASGQSLLWLRATIGPSVRFFGMYVLKLGFLDGAAGYRIARISASEVGLKYKIARNIQRG